MSPFEQWSQDVDFDFSDLQARLEYAAIHIFDTYEPTRGRSNFAQRLRDWLASAEDEDDSKRLFGLLEHLYFISSEEFDVLYREAYRTHIIWWLLEGSTSLDAGCLHSELQDAIRTTWFCPLTDSMQIARFHHLNRITGKDLRPDWRTLAELGDKGRITSYMHDNGFKRLVLLDDFVGSGSQSSRAVEFALEVEAVDRMLVLPLVICPPGLDRLAAAVEPSSGRAVLQPMVVLPTECVLSPTLEEGEPDSFTELRALLRRLEPLVGSEALDQDERVFGFGKVGALSVMHTNCPNNAPPVLHFASPTWQPLFPRSSRV